MAGFVPGLLPSNHSQEKEFAQAYEDVLERYKGKCTEIFSRMQEDNIKKAIPRGIVKAFVCIVRE